VCLDPFLLCEPADVDSAVSAEDLMAESGFLFSFVVYLSGGPACSPIKYIHDVKSLFDVIVKYIHDVKSLFNNILLILPVKNRIVPLSGTITCSVLLGVLLMCCCVFHILKPYISRKLSFSPFDSCILDTLDALNLCLTINQP